MYWSQQHLLSDDSDIHGCCNTACEHVLMVEPVLFDNSSATDDTEEKSVCSGSPALFNSGLFDQVSGSGMFYHLPPSSIQLFLFEIVHNLSLWPANRVGLNFSSVSALPLMQCFVYIHQSPHTCLMIQSPQQSLVIIIIPWIPTQNSSAVALPFNQSEEVWQFPISCSCASIQVVSVAACWSICPSCQRPCILSQWR